MVVEVEQRVRATRAVRSRRAVVTSRHPTARAPRSRSRSQSQLILSFRLRRCAVLPAASSSLSVFLGHQVRQNLKVLHNPRAGRNGGDEGLAVEIAQPQELVVLYP